MRPPGATIVLPQPACRQNGSGTRSRRYDSIGATGYNAEDAGEARESTARGGALAARTFASHSNTGYTRPHTVRGGRGGVFAPARGNKDGKPPGGVFIREREILEPLGRWEV